MGPEAEKTAIPSQMSNLDLLCPLQDQQPEDLLRHIQYLSSHKNNLDIQLANQVYQAKHLVKNNQVHFLRTQVPVLKVDLLQLRVSLHFLVILLQDNPNSLDTPKVHLVPLLLVNQGFQYLNLSTHSLVFHRILLLKVMDSRLMKLQLVILLLDNLNLLQHFLKFNRSTLPPLQQTTTEGPGLPEQPSEQPEEHAAIPEGTVAPEGPEPVPSEGPSEAPQPVPSEGPVEVPSEGPEPVPSEGPAAVPSEGPEPVPSEGPEPVPSEGPEPVPSEGPEPVPSEGPEPVLSEGPEPVPSEGPAPVPSEGPETIPSEGSILPEEPGATLPSSGISVPSGFTTSTTSAPSETEKPAEGAPAETDSYGSTISPEANTIPGKPEPSVVDEEELKHPPHIHAIDVQCSKEMMTINIEFNREFNGVIYSKGHYNTPECRYVQENSAQTKYSFTVNLEMCGTEFVNAFDTENKSYLENVLVLQNEPGIQEVWDTVRSVRCLWEGNIKDTLSVAFSIGMLSQEIVTFSGDTAMAKLDVVLGRGPFGEPANGLVKIGEQMTMVVSVSGDPGFDLQVKDCKAVDSEGKNSVALTDEDGCILKPKLFGAFQKTRDTGSTGASIIAYAYFNAFKFPDEMDLMIECNIELCKTDCDICSKEGQQLEPAKRRRRRDASYNTTVTGDWVTMGKLVRVILPEDLNENTALEVSSRNHICMSIQSFVFSTAVLVSILVLSCFTCVCLWMKRREKMYLKY